MKLIVFTPDGPDDWDLVGFQKSEVPDLVKKEFGDFDFKVVD